MATRNARVYRRAVPRDSGPSDFAQLRARALREQAALVDRLVAFSERALGTPWSSDEAEDALLHYLADRGASLLPGAPTNGPLDLPTSSAPNADFVLNSFVKHLSGRDPEGFEYLTTAVKGSVLASVLYFDDLGSVNRKFDDLVVYLDTVVLLQALGRLQVRQGTRILYGRKWLSWWLSRKPISCCRWPFRDPLHACSVTNPQSHFLPYRTRIDVWK